MGLYSLGAKSAVKYMGLYSSGAKSAVKYMGLYSLGAKSATGKRRNPRKTKGKATTLCYWPAGPPSNNSVLLTGVRRRPGNAEKCKHGKPSRPEAYF